MKDLSEFIDIQPEVEQALHEGLALVALESSIVAQGFPAPDNLALGREMASAVREAGAIPAQIAVFDRRIKIGLGDPDLERLAMGNALKCSARDLAFAVATGTDGATTVAATARVAALVGIGVFATGGIGGVHPGRGGMDVSADLAELSRVPVAVVCSGAKSILDLPATLEALETLGVPVVGYRCDELPAFHSIESGLALRCRIDDPSTLARMMSAHWALSPGGGIVVCNPPPAEFALSKVELAALVEAAIDDAAAKSIRGAALTPYLLRQLNEQSMGRTLAVNRALVLSNAHLAAVISGALVAEYLD